MRAKKSLGQHFLMHRHIAARIVQTANVVAQDTVLEIGPGTGVLTRELLARGARVYAIEADADLARQLRETFAKEIAAGALVLSVEDARIFDPRALPAPYKLVANIPYYITGNLLRLFLETPHKPFSLTLLVQKEVAVRVARSQKESLLSLAVKAYGTPHYVFTVPRGAFVPPPSVDSAVLSVDNINNPFLTAEEERAFFSLLKTGFSHKRKLLARNLESLLPKSVISQAFLSCGVAEKARAEDLSVSVWRCLAVAVLAHGYREKK